MALAYFITWTTYGTWLHGTDKGAGSVDMVHNQYGAPFLPPDPERLKKAKEAMTQPEYWMDTPRRAIVRDAIVEICAEKNWKLWAVHVRSNHVHVVMWAEGDVDRHMNALKARASRNLNPCRL
jgi:hypothetical protein